MNINGRDVTSVQKLQSEMGVVGEVSPNAEFVINNNKLVQDTFRANRPDQNSHGDCYLLFAQVQVGNKIGDEDLKGMAVNNVLIGNDMRIIEMVSNYLASDKKLLRMMAVAVLTAGMDSGEIQKGREKNDGPQDELLRKLMGFDKDKNDSDKTDLN